MKNKALLQHRLFGSLFAIATTALSLALAGNAHAGFTEGAFYIVHVKTESLNPVKSFRECWHIQGNDVLIANPSGIATDTLWLTASWIPELQGDGENAIVLDRDSPEYLSDVEDFDFSEYRQATRLQFDANNPGRFRGSRFVSIGGTVIGSLQWVDLVQGVQVENCQRGYDSSPPQP